MDPRIQRAIAFIERNLHADIRIANLAVYAELSVAQFTRLFRRDVGLAPLAYLSKLRMERARVLLERTTLSVNDVMAQVGILDPSHFARDFRRAHGFSPRSYREHIRVGGGSVP